MKISRRILSMLLAMLLVVSLLPGTLAAPETDAPPSDFGAAYQADDMVRAVVLFKGSPAADVGGRGTAKALTQMAIVEKQHTAFLQSLDRKSIPYELNYSYCALLNGVSVTVAYKELDKLRAMDGVQEVHIANTYLLPETEQPQMNSSNAMTGAALAHTEGFNGKGTVIAVLDTGLNLNHEAFQDYGLTDKVITKRTLLNTETRGQYISTKIPFAYDYAGHDDDVTDHHGHGTHVAGIAAGYAQDADGNVTFSGTAPAAQLLIMKIFGDESSGTSSDTYFAALEDAYLLGADVVNMSIGSPDGFSYDYSMETAFGNIYDRLYNAGVIVCVAAGNEYSQAAFTRNQLGNSVLASYADYGVVGSPSTFASNTSVASAENDTYPTYTIEVDGTPFAYRDKTTGTNMHISFSGKTIPYVMIPGEGDYKDYDGLDVKGKIAVVERGGLDFSDKVHYASIKGAVGLIVYNNAPGAFSMSVETYYIPAVSVTQAVGELLKNAENKTLTFPNEEVIMDNPDAGTMSDFSNWGTTSDLRLKPTITAVGGSVYSANYNTDNGYELMSGTSMATPNAAGCYALILQAVHQAYPELSKPEQLKLAQSIAESTAQIVAPEGAAYSPRKQGAGLMQVLNAVTSDVYLQDPMYELGDDPEKTGTYTFGIVIERPTGECKEHEYVRRVTVQPTCIEPGEAEFQCEKCHISYTEPIPALGHEWDNGTQTKAPTQFAEGEMTFTCKRDPSHTEVRPIAKLEKCDGGDACPSIELTDVDRSPESWYHEAVDWAVVNNITKGTSADKFSPAAFCTRAQAVTFIWRAKGEPEPTTTANPFKDVPADAYYYKAVLWAAENEITNGVSADTFAPDATCTRGQIVTFLWRAEGKPAAQASTGFSDVAAGAYYADAVAWAVACGITNGTSPTTFSPDASCTRAHIVTFLWRNAFRAEPDTGASAQSLKEPLEPQKTVYTIAPKVLVDVVKEQNGTLYNTLQQKEAAVELTAVCDGETLRDNKITFESWETEKTVTVTIKLKDETRQYLDASFENGSFVDGYVMVTPEDGGDPVHATFLAFYGDWAKAPILSPYDFRDMMNALSTIYWERENTDIIRNIYQVNELDIDYSLVYVGAFQVYKVLGSNPFEGRFHSQYDASNCFLSNNKQSCFNTGLYIYPAQLRNARHMILTITDNETGEIYSHQELEYVGKAYYAGAEYSWQPRGFFSWFGTDLDDSDLLNGTSVTVSVYANLDYGEDALANIPAKELAAKAQDYLVWQFDLTIDSKAPTIDEVSYDPETKQLTVKASDNYTMAYIGVEDADPDLAFDYIDLKEGSEDGVYVLDLSMFAGTKVTIRAEDMAANRTTLQFELPAA